MSERTPLLDGQRAGEEQIDYRGDVTPPNNVHVVDNGLKAPLNNPSTTDLIWILAALWSAVFLGALDGTIVATLISPIGSYFEKAHQASYLGTSYLLSVCCFTPLYGRLSDILGRKGAMLLGLTLFGAGTILCGLAPSMETLIAARAIAGMGGGGVMTVSSIAVSDLVPLKRRGLYQGFANILFGAGSGLGGPLGGFLNDRWGWRSAFLIQIPIIVISFIMTMIKANIKIPEQAQTLREKLARIDWLGSLTLVIAVGSLLLGISFKTTEELPWESPLVWGLLSTSVVGGTLFFLVEKYWSKEPIMPLRLLTQRTPLAVAISNFATAMVAFSAMYFVPLYFSAVRLQSATESGMHLLPSSIAVSLGSLFAGWVMRSTGKYWWLTVLSACSGLFACVNIALWNENTSDFHLWFDIAPNGFGLSSLITSTLIALISAVDRDDMAVATGISYLFRTTGQVLGVSLGGGISQSVLSRQLRQKIHGPDAAEIIRQIRHSTAIIPTLEPDLRKAAVDSWAFALRVVFIAQAAMAFVALLACLPIQEFDLPGTHEEHDANKRKSAPYSDSDVNPEQSP